MRKVKGKSKKRPVKRSAKPKRRERYSGYQYLAERVQQLESDLSALRSAWSLPGKVGEKAENARVDVQTLRDEVRRINLFLQREYRWPTPAAPDPPAYR